ncbi:MAG: NADH-quinone oxidoreductase subunit NuoH, partial [Planctomycetes bacterium]|nr:NADH-quinone oxidoreductase subunit NuoH [Planctomycetota bacterium]
MAFGLLFLKILVVMLTLQGVVAYLIYVERKVCAYMQNRVGPNRVGWHGLLQPIADVVKLLLKEPFVPNDANKVLFVLAPAIAVFTTTLGFAVVPFGPTTPGDPKSFVIAPGIDVGILFIFAVSSLAVYAVILAGWSSNSKYSFLGGLRSSAQFISYEIPLGLSILGVVLITGSLNLERIIAYQADHVWLVFYQPLSVLLFFTSALAECNRLPFDLPECEQELVGGYNTEYSGMQWAMFFFGEYTHMITVSFLTAILFFGGWDLPWVISAGQTGFIASLAKVLVLLAKGFAGILFMMWIRWTLPRFRFDQLMNLAWRAF